MNWRDLLYFSKGERRALALLLCLITISWILLLWTNTKRMPIEAQTDAHRTENRQAPGERRIITGKNTSEGGKNFIRKESGPHPNYNPQNRLFVIPKRNVSVLRPFSKTKRLFLKQNQTAFKWASNPI